MCHENETLDEYLNPWDDKDRLGSIMDKIREPNLE